MTRDERGRFVKGKSGNPAGRKPRATEQDFLDLLKDAVTEDDWRLVVHRAVDQAKKGDPSARKFLADYLIGPPPQRHEINTEMPLLIWNMPSVTD